MSKLITNAVESLTAGATDFPNSLSIQGTLVPSGSAATEPTSRFQYVVGSVAELRAIGPGVAKPGQTVSTKGYYADGDGGSNDYVIELRDGSLDDGGSVIYLDDGVHQARGLFLGEIIRASQFGVLESTEDAGPTIQNMIERYGSRNVIVDTPVTISTPITLSDQSVNIEFLHDVEFTAETGVFIDVSNNYENVLDVTDLSLVNPSYLSGAFDTATELTVSGVIPSDAKGRVLRIVSDDTDPHSNSADNRIGEPATVAAVNGDTVGLSGILEDHALYTTNVRAAFLNDHTVSIKAKRVKGILANVTPRIYIKACNRPEINAHFDGITGTGVLLIGCHIADISVTGTNHSNSSAALGYLINDVSGYNCVFRDPASDRCRHVTTTNFNGVNADDARIERYGATRYHTVLNGHAGYAEASAFDSHAGSRYSRWVNCSADHIKTGERGGTSSLFQIRGYKEVTEGGLCGPDVQFFARVLAEAILPVINNPVSYARRFISCDGNDFEGNQTTVNGGYIDMLGGFFFGVRGTSGAVIVMKSPVIKAQYTAGHQLFDLLASFAYVTDATLILSTTNPGSTRLVRYRNGACKLEFSGRVKMSGINKTINNVLDNGGGGEIDARVKLHTDGSINPASGAVTGSYEHLIVRENPPSAGDNVRSSTVGFDEYLRHVATL